MRVDIPREVKNLAYRVALTPSGSPGDAPEAAVLGCTCRPAAGGLV